MCSSNAIRYPINAQAGKVSIHASSISLTTPQLTLDTRLAAAAPMIAVPLVLVVLSGMPNVVATSMQAEAATSDENP